VRVFVAGASGAIGRPLVRRLIASGHDVTGMTRRPERGEEIEAAGAAVAVCDVYDTDALDAAVAEARPEVLVHQLTSLPWRLDPRKPETYEATNRVRTEGTRNLVHAARAAGARRIVAQSIAAIYAPVGGWVKSEDDPVLEGIPGHFGEAMDAILDLERQVTQAEGLEGLALRYGFFYGPHTQYAPDGYWAQEVRRRRFPVVGTGEGMLSFIQVEDAAGATAAACERGASGIYNVVDDDPAPLRDWLPAYAEALGARRPLRVPVWLAKLVAGRQIVAMATSTRGASNEKAKRELGWEPLYSSWRMGFREALGG
jgi:nucleoside-diphosphate-sugar epimerase